MKKITSHIKENRKLYLIISAMYLLLLAIRYLVNINNFSWLGTLFRPIEIISTFLSVLILKEVVDIKKDYYKKATSEKHKESKISQENLEFLTMYMEEERKMNKIKKDCKNFQDMKENIQYLNDICPFLKMFQNTISDRLFEKEDTEKYRNSFKRFKESIDFFSSDNSEFGIEDTNKADEYIDNIKDLIDHSTICIKDNFSNNEDLMDKYEKLVQKESENEEAKRAKEADETDDNDL